MSVSPLFKDAREEVRFERWEPHSRVRVDATGGAELFVLEGGFEESGDVLREHSWLRVPPGTLLEAEAGPEGTRVWIKSGHLGA